MMCLMFEKRSDLRVKTKGASHSQGGRADQARKERVPRANDEYHFIATPMPLSVEIIIYKTILSIENFLLVVADPKMLCPP